MFWGCPTTLVRIGWLRRKFAVVVSLTTSGSSVRCSPLAVSVGLGSEYFGLCCTCVGEYLVVDWTRSEKKKVVEQSDHGRKLPKRDYVVRKWPSHLAQVSFPGLVCVRDSVVLFIVPARWWKWPWWDLFIYFHALDVLLWVDCSRHELETAQLATVFGLRQEWMMELQLKEISKELRALRRVNSDAEYFLQKVKSWSDFRILGGEGEVMR